MMTNDSKPKENLSDYLKKPTESAIWTPEQELKKAQLREENDTLIRRLVEARVFRNKDHVIRAALSALMAGLVQMQRVQQQAAKEALDQATEKQNATGSQENSDVPANQGEQVTDVAATTGPGSTGDAQAPE